MERKITSMKILGPDFEGWEDLLELEESLESTFPDLNFYGFSILHVVATHENTPPGYCVRVMMFCPSTQAFADELKAVFPAIQAWCLAHGISATIAPRPHADAGIINGRIGNLLPETVELVED